MYVGGAINAMYFVYSDTNDFSAANAQLLSLKTNLINTPLPLVLHYSPK